EPRPGGNSTARYGKTIAAALEFEPTAASVDGPGHGSLSATVTAPPPTLAGFPTTVVEAPPPRTGAARIKITDFGLARHIVDTESLAMTAAGALLGTPHYMAPEQWTGRTVDARTDVYAMGATLFHLLAGRPPFMGDNRDAICAQHCNEAAPRV